MNEENYENINLKNTIDELENDNKNKLTEISYLYNKCKKLEKSNNIYKSLFGNEMPLEITTLRNKNKVLESNLKKFDETFKNEMEKRDDEISFLEITNFNLENENNNLNQKLQDCETIINQLKSEKESMQEAITTLKNTNESISKTLEQQSQSWLPKFF
tara:strand:- start:965 stop:1441 length:477 start_codon:yes stop_codon:yes gene_type:complete